jgi:alkanesulfonate monooxygenase SsuD/methylene tetrahydromethanopterin reductase-like flavin-dependent oxidoreductase (luciferase family)
VSQGRLVVGVAAGNRPDDYAVAEQSMRGRHRRLDEMLERMQRIWAADEPEFAAMGPAVDGDPPILIGGRAAGAFERAARFGAGWTVGFASPDRVREGVADLERAWGRAGRDGRPRVVALTYFALGADAPVRGAAYLRGYYEFLGAEVADRVAATAPTDADSVAEVLDGFAAAGVDELVFLPAVPGLEQLDLLADVVAASPAAEQT